MKEHFFYKNRFILLSFAIPFAIMTIVFAIMKVSPFGEQQILVNDLWQQYYPFLLDYQDKLKNGESLFWSWTQGGGINYISLISYYLASPLNILSIFIPKELLREFLMFSVVVRISCAGMFMAIFLREIYKRNNWSIVWFGCCFSFSAFFMGYYWNTIWLDAVCLTPLVVLGAVKLLKENKFRLYTISLALSLISNYYIGFFICIFMLLVFAAYSIIHWENRTVLGKNLIKMALFSAIAIGITAFLLLPAFLGLQVTEASTSSFPTEFAINIGNTNDMSGVLYAIRAIASNFITFIPPATLSGDALPNIACGTISILLGILFFTTKKIVRKEKLVGAGLLLFMIISCIIRQLDYIWHGFHFTNMIPYRFSFLISFILIVMAFRAFMFIDFCRVKNILFTVWTMGIILLFAGEYEQENKAIVWTVLISAIICGILFLFVKRKVSKQLLMLLLTAIVIGESGATAYLGVKTTRVTSTASYPREGKSVKKVVDHMKQLEKETAEMWRTEVTAPQTFNDGSLNDYNGFSAFNSMSNVNVTRFFENIGLMGWKGGNRYNYMESSTITNTFLNLKYIIARDGIVRNTYDLKEVFTEDKVKLYENEHYIPMGFMTESELTDWTANDNEYRFNPFETQGEIFKLATGIEESVYIPVEVQTQGHTEDENFTIYKTAYGNYSFECKSTEIIPTLKWNFEVPEDGIYCMYEKTTGGDKVTVTRRESYEDEPQDNGTYGMKRPYIANLGYFNKGEIISVLLELPQGQSGTAQIYMNKFNTEVFEKGYDRITRDVMKTTYLSGNRMEGTIDVNEDGLFYTSIPYEKGWNAKVDGKEVEITPVGNALLAFPLAVGSHEIELEFCPRGFRAGLVVTLVSLGIFLLLCILDRRGGVLEYMNIWEREKMIFEEGQEAERENTERERTRADEAETRADEAEAEIKR